MTLNGAFDLSGLPVYRLHKLAHVECDPWYIQTVIMMNTYIAWNLKVFRTKIIL